MNIYNLDVRKYAVETLDGRRYEFHLKDVEAGMGFRRYHQAKVTELYMALRIDKEQLAGYLEKITNIQMGVGEWAKRSEGDRLKEAAAAVNILSQKIKLTEDFNLDLALSACFWCFEGEDFNEPCPSELIAKKIDIWSNDKANDFEKKQGAYFFFVMWGAKTCEQRANLLNTTTLNYLAQMNYLTQILNAAPQF